MADWNFSKLAQTLWKTCADNGVAAWLRPGQMRRDAYGRADAKRIEAQGDFDAEQILRGEKTLADFQLAQRRRIAHLEERTEPDFDLDALPSLIQDQHATELMRKEVNVAKALLRAEEELQQDTSPVPEKEVDGDWLRRWRDIVGDVSGEDLQSLWGRLLAGEVKSPGKHSLRTLDIIRNISSEDAQLISKLAPFSFDGFVWRDPSGINQHFARAGLTFSDLLYFEEIGIVTGASSGLTNSWLKGDNVDEFVALIVKEKLCLRITHTDPQARFEIGGMALTRAGAQILDLCQVTSDEMYLREFGAHAVSKGFRAELCRIVDRGDGIEVLLKLEEL